MTGKNRRPGTTNGFIPNANAAPLPESPYSFQCPHPSVLVRKDIRYTFHPKLLTSAECARSNSSMTSEQNNGSGLDVLSNNSSRARESAYTSSDESLEAV